MILVISSKTSYGIKRLQEECSLKDIECRVLDVQDLIDCNFKISPEGYKVLYIRNPYLNGSPKYIPQIIKLAKKFKQAGKRVVDESITSGNLGGGKWLDYKILLKAGLPIPKTKLFSNLPLSTTDYPLVLKWIYGMSGKNVFLIKSQKEFKKTLSLHPKQEWLVQEYINADFEFEVYVVGFKPVKKILGFKINNGFKANVKDFAVIKGVKDFKGYVEALKISAKASKILGRELCKIDMLAKDGKLFILEVNRNPGLVSFESLIRYNIAKEFVNYLNR